MNFNIYLDDKIGQRLQNATKNSKKSRNALIREAIDFWLQTHDKTRWPDEILEFHGEKDFPAFETNRDDLDPTDHDPFA